MALVKLFSLAFLICHFGIAATATVLIPNPTGVSLNAALRELNVVVPLRYDHYPFVSFGAAPDARTIAVVINRKVAPTDSDLASKAVIINVANRRSNVIAIVDHLPDSRLRNRQAHELKFIDENLVRIEVQSQWVNDTTKRRNHRTYEFFDTKSKKHFSIESELGFDHISDVRALGKYHYLVRHFEKGRPANTAIYYNPVTDTLKILDTPYDDVAHAVRNANGFPGEDVWHTGDDGTFVHISLNSKRAHDDHYTYFMGRLKAKVLPGHVGGIYDEGGTFVLNGNDSRTLTGDDFIEYSKDGEALLGKWPQPKEGQLYPPFHLVGEYLVGDFSSYPQYGWVRLKPGQDQIELITNPYFHLVYSQVLADKIVGLGQYDVLARDITFYMLPVTGKMTAAQAQVPASMFPKSKPKLPVVPITQALPIVSSLEDGRYLFVQLNAERLIIIDTEHPDRVVQRIDLLDSDFKIIHTNEKETLIHYPKTKQVVTYERNTFQQLSTMKESECDHLLNPRK